MKYTTRTLLETFPRARYQALHQNFLGRSPEFALISGQSLLSVATEEGKTTVTSSVFFPELSADSVGTDELQAALDVHGD